MKVKAFTCTGWSNLRRTLAEALDHVGGEPGEEAWYRGATQSGLQLLPSLFWTGAKLSRTRLDALEQDLFFEFQARARELHERSLSDWDYLFFMRHHHVPTRILDWTDSFGVAAYFALDGAPGEAPSSPAIWVLNPYKLNADTWGIRDLVQPKYLGKISGEFWDYGELLNARGPWRHDGPVAIYPLQISDRMRAQRGWFTMFGNSRKPLEVQYPHALARMDFTPKAVDDLREFVKLAGLQPYAIYPDLDHLGEEVLRSNWP